MNGRGRRNKPKPPPDLTKEERREWWLRQARKWVWGPGDIVITRRGDGQKPKEDDRGNSLEQ